jgi:hypothetical protein
MATNCDKAYSDNALKRNRFGTNKRSNNYARLQMERTNKNVSNRRRYLLESL